MYGTWKHSGNRVTQSGISCRKALGRTGTSLLAQGSDGIRIQSEVKLLDEQEGQYMIGSVQFTKPHKTPRPGSTTLSADMDASESSRPSLDTVMGSARGQALLDSQVGKHITVTIIIASTTTATATSVTVTTVVQVCQSCPGPIMSSGALCARAPLGLVLDCYLGLIHAGMCAHMADMIPIGQCNSCSRAVSIAQHACQWLIEDH